jgi:hypothetical protein
LNPSSDALVSFFKKKEKWKTLLKNGMPIPQIGFFEMPKV